MNPNVPEDLKKIVELCNLASAKGPAEALKGNIFLLDEEKEQLRTLGVDPEGPIDQSKIDMLMNEAKKAMGDLPKPKLPDAPLRMPEEVPIESLDEKDRQDYLRYIERAKRMLEKYKESQLGSVVQEGGAKDYEDTEEAENGEPAEEEVHGKDGGEGIDETRHVCPSCGWVLDPEKEPKITEDDKMAFEVSLLGGKRFRRIYSALQGKVRVRFRSLTTREEACVRNCMARVANQDNKDGIMRAPADYGSLAAKYKLCLGLDTIEIQGGECKYNADLASLAAGVESAPLEDVLQNRLERFLEEFLPQEHLYSLVLNLFIQFELLYRTLLAKAYDPNF